MRAEQENSGELVGNEGAWTAFHHAYDSAMRAWRRGPDVSRAVNWLFVASRDGTSDEEREVERQNRELGLKLGVAAKNEVEIAPLIWQAARDGALLTGPRPLAAAMSDGAAPEKPAAPASPAPDEGGGGKNVPDVPGIQLSPELPGSGDVLYPEGVEPPAAPAEPEKPGNGKPGPGFSWEYLI